jgi:hypothetical protein
MPEQQLDQATNQANPVVMGIIGIVYLAIVLILIISMWKIFTKAGEPGWAAIIPVYNTIVFLKIAGKPIWWVILFFIPFANLIVAILALVSFAERFGKGTGFVIGCIFLPFVFLPMLAFGDAKYLGPKTA